MAMGSALVWCFERFPSPVIDKVVTSKDDAGERQPEKDDRLCCGACSHPITRKRAGISMQGAHEHQFTNPHGLTFRVGCYGEAPGCRPIGEATDEHTWFSGYAWRVAICGSCRQHLGWSFHGLDRGRFFALIVDRLASAP